MNSILQIQIIELEEKINKMRIDFAKNHFLIKNIKDDNDWLAVYTVYETIAREEENEKRKKSIVNM